MYINIRKTGFCVIVIILLIIFNNSFVIAQNFSVKGKLINKEDMLSLPGAAVLLVNVSDSLKSVIAVSNEKGAFSFSNVKAQKYRLKVLYFNKLLYQKTINVEKNLSMGDILLEKLPIILDAVAIEAKEERVSQKGDTLVYNANAYKTNPDANVEDLVKKMPGITVQDGKIKAQGEELKKVLVDGSEFFGDDASLALKNLPSEIVDKVQIFDKLSDQAQFTGFNDGNTEKTMNIVTKNGKSNGQFGKIYGGIGDDGKYLAGLNLNYFSGQQRISLLGLSNNINQQNFSMQDILGVMNTGSQSSRSSRSSGRTGFTDFSNFMTGQQGGINTTHSYGLNYTNKWDEKASLSASYFFNNSKNETSSKLARQYILGENSTQYYNENSSSSNNNYNHRFNARFVYNIDTLNSIILTPRLSFQNNKSLSGSDASTLLLDTILNSDNNSKKTESSGYNFSNNLLFRHKFNLKRRTFSLNFNTAFNDRTGTSNLYSLSEYYIKNDTVLTDQFTESSTEGKTIGANINYTEPVGKKAILQFTLYSGYNENNIDKYTYLRDTEQKLFTDIDSTLSNDYSNKVYTQRAGLSYRYSGDNFNFSTGFNLQNEILKGKQLFPYSYKNDYNFNSLLPTAMFFYKFTKTSNLRMFYRSSTNTPDANQLQDVIDNSNPLSLKAGNPELKQDFSHNLIARFGTTNINKATSFFGFVNFGITDNRIANAVYLPVSDTIVNAGKNKISLSKGTQLTLPVNLDGYRNLGSFLTFGFPASFIKCNINLNGGVNYNRLPGLINNRENISENYSSNGGAAISSNISEKIDFNLSYSYNYNFVENTIQSSSDNNYSTQTASGRLYLSLWKGLTLNSDISYILYKGLGAGLNQDLILLNGGLSYKFLKNNAAEIKLSIYDLLNENKSISRTITDTYIEDSEIKVLKRYMMLSFTYNIRNFKSN